MPTSTSILSRLRVTRIGPVLLACACSSPAAGPVGAPTPDAEPARVATPTADEVDVGKAHLQRSFDFERGGDLAGARMEAEAALAAGVGRDATIQVAKVAILQGRHDDAIQILDPLVHADPKDAAAQYNRALAHHHKGDYNLARTGYLSAVRQDSSYADARYNLALLCLDHGFAEEAQHHATSFRMDYPSDPRVAQLERIVAGAAGAQPPPNSAPTVSGEAAGKALPGPRDPEKPHL